MNQPIANHSYNFKYGHWEGQDQFSDAILYTDDGTQFPIHRIILSRSSQYFQGLFSFDSSRNIKISEIDGQIMEQILVFIYTGQAALNKENVWGLMIAADYLLMDDLMRECRSFAVRTLNVGNCMSATATAFKIEKLSLFQDCLRFAIVHFEKIVGDSTTDLEQVPFEILSMLLRSDRLNVSTERTVWMAIARWVTSDTENRLFHVPELLANIRLRSHSRKSERDLAKEVLTHEVVKDNPFVHLCLTVRVNYYLNYWHLLRQLVSSQLQAMGRAVEERRLPRHLHFVARGRELYVTIDEGLDWYRKIGDVPFLAEAIVRVGNILYVFNTSDNVCMSFDVVNGTWPDMTQMCVGRRNYSVVTLKGCVYTVGGMINHYRYTDQMECFHPQWNYWHHVSPGEEMGIGATVVHKGNIYAIGQDFNTMEPAMMCQKYNADADSWMTVSPPRIYRKGWLSCVVFGSSLILVGGETHSGHLKCVEQYNPGSDTWDLLPDLPFSYFTPKAVVVEDKLVVLDNYNHEDSTFCTVLPPVMWNTESRTWDAIDNESLFYGVQKYVFCKVEDQKLVEKLTLKNRSPVVELLRRD